MVLDFYKEPDVEQCQLADSASGVEGSMCCSNPTSEVCNRPLKDDEISMLWTTRGIQHIPISSKITFQKLRDEIEAGRPVEVAWERDIGDHLVIVHGWRVTSTGEQVYVNDPAQGGGEGWMSFSDLESPSSGGFWDSTWVGLRR
jgi:hypothetical protein